MCLIVFAWKTHPEYRLILAANRDEYHQRPAQEMHWWSDKPEVLAGRDLQAGGTWLATSRTGRFATVTNYREQQDPHSGLCSRGELVTDFVTGDLSPWDFHASLQGEKFAGFSLLSIDHESLCYVSNRGDDVTSLAPGVYGLSNASLDTPWPKLLRSRDKLSELIEDKNVNETTLLRLMADRKPARVADVRNDILPFTVASALSAPFILTPEYGTRCASTVLWDYDNRISMSERRFDPDGVVTGESNFSFAAECSTASHPAGL